MFEPDDAVTEVAVELNAETGVDMDPEPPIALFAEVLVEPTPLVTVDVRFGVEEDAALSVDGSEAGIAPPGVIFSTAY